MKSPLKVLFFVALLARSLWAQTPTVLNRSTDLVRLGIAASNLTPNQATLNAGPLLESAIRYAVTNRLGRVVAEPGAYYFLSGSATSANWHAVFAGPASVPLTVDFQGADLYFAQTPKGGFFVTSGTNLTLQNFTMDCVQQLYTTAAAGRLSWRSTKCPDSQRRIYPPPGH